MSAARRIAVVPVFALLAGLLAWMPITLGLAPTAHAGDRRVVPDVVDLPLAAAQAELTAAGFRSKVVPATDASAGQIGTVARQQPGGFWWSDTSAEVTLFVRGQAGPASAPSTGPGTTPPVPPRNPGTGPAPTDPAPSLPNVVGMTEGEALGKLSSWRVTVNPVDAGAASEGRVVTQTPPPGSALAASGIVTLSVGRAGAPPPGAARVPNVVGLDMDTAMATLRGARLLPMINRVASDVSKDGQVISQEPIAGVVLAQDSNVIVNVGRAPSTPLAEVDVPNLVRRSEIEARGRLADAGLRVTVRDQLADAQSANLVVSQDPLPGARVARGAAVTLVVGRILLLPVAVPDVLNRDAAEATRALEDAGFVVEKTMVNSLQSGWGRVTLQDPAGAQSAIRGSVVRISVGQSIGVPGGVPAPSNTQPFGTAGTPIPDVTGLPEATAQQRLQALGFRVARQPLPGLASEAGTARGTQPPAGTNLASGAQVTLLVVEGGTPATSPLTNYVGQHVATAQADLVAHGYAVTVSPVVSPGAVDGQVVAQSPIAGSPVAPGATILLTVSRAPTLGQPILIGPRDQANLPKSGGVLFQWSPVPDAEDYQFEIFRWKDDTWVVADNDITQGTQKRPSRVHAGIYNWHIRARKGRGAVTGPWSELRRLTIY